MLNGEKFRCNEYHNNDNLMYSGGILAIDISLIANQPRYCHDVIGRPGELIMFCVMSMVFYRSNLITPVTTEQFCQSLLSNFVFIQDDLQGKNMIQ